MKSDIKRAKFGKKIVETETFSIDTRIKIIRWNNCNSGQLEWMRVL